MKREDVICIAASLFVEKGYHGTSIRDIAKKCGLTPSSLYSHVSSKEEILFDITMKGANVFIDAIKPIAMSTGSPLERIKEAIFIHINLLITNKEGAQIFLNEWKFLSEENRTKLLKKRREYEQYWVDILKDGITKKIIKRGNPELMLIFIMSVLNWVYQWYNPEGPFTAKEIASDYVDKIFNGIATEPFHN